MFLSNDWGSAATQARAYAQSGGLVADKIEQVASTLEALGSRHASYGVQRSHYDTIGKALIATLERGLGEAWTVKAAAAWREAYDIVAGAMRRAPVRAVSSRTGVWSFGAR
jgi:hemoglobin-like flavoprotein